MQLHFFSHTTYSKKIIRLVLIIAIILASTFIDPHKLGTSYFASDFMLIAWDPGHELLTNGSINAGYPYPMWTAVIMLLFTVWPPQMAMVLWFIFNLCMLAASLVLLIRLFDWGTSPIPFGPIIISSILFLPVMTSLWIGQLTIFSLLILTLTTHLFLSQRWTLLGIVLGLSFIKPQVMLLLAGLLLLWALCQQRWQTLLGFSSVIIILTIISLPFISSPIQIIGGGISSHLTTYMQRSSTLWGLFLSLGITWFVPLIISLALLTWLVWVWLPLLRGIEKSPNRVLFLFSAAIMVNLMAIPYSWMHNLILLLLPLGYSLSLILKIKGRVRFLWLGLLLFIMYPLAFGLFITLNGPDHNQSYQIIPALILLPTMYILEFQTIQQRS